MQKTSVLILADGIVAKHFLKRLVELKTSQNQYYVVYQDEDIKPKEESEYIFFYRFDPTSFVKLSTLFSRRYKEVILLLGNKIDTLASFENIRKLDKNSTIILLDRWDLEIEDKNYIRLSANEILSSRVFDHLPNVPVLAQNVGLGQGEIMEVLVPFGSSYVYRHVGSIEQKNWKIAAIYRHNKLILPAPNIMIWPNDLLLLIGEPKVLLEVFKSIKKEVGQFPLPYGTNAYLFIDMAYLSKEDLHYLVLNAIFLHKRLNNKKLFIRIINPNNFAFLSFIKAYDSNDIEIWIDYFQSGNELVIQDIKTKRVGLIILHQKSFLDRELRKMLYQFSLPVLSLANSSFEKVQEAALLLSDNLYLENVSATIFDITIQLKLSLLIYEYSEDSRPEHKSVVEHFESLANIFSKPIAIKKIKSNPIRELNLEKEKLLIYPFSRYILKSMLWNIFCTNVEALFYKLSKHHQLFLPKS